jgi:hypothetical protein
MHQRECTRLRGRASSLAANPAEHHRVHRADPRATLGRASQGRGRALAPARGAALLHLWLDSAVLRPLRLSYAG